MNDFSTDSMRFRATERHIGAYYDPRAIYGTVPPPHNPWEWLAAMMRRAVTPYWPSSDLPKGPWDEGL